MGPTNVALVNLFRADQALRQAQERLDAANKNVRIQERRVNELSEKLRLGQTSLLENKARAGQVELDVASREAHIEKLRSQQANTKNNKEYQAFLVEINTSKLDKAKLEEEQIKAMEAVEKIQGEVAILQAQVETERGKLDVMKGQIGDTVKRLEAEVNALKPTRDAAAAAAPARGREAFERLAERNDGDALSAVCKPDRRREEYLCTECNMELVRDIYNKLHTRDEIIFCPSCARILYIPEDFTPAMAIGVALRPAGARPQEDAHRQAQGGQGAGCGRVGANRF